MPTILTKQPNGSFVVRDQQTYEELLKEEIKQEQQPKPKPKSNQWQLELHDEIIDRGVR